MPSDAEPRHTAEALVTAARQRGYPATKRLVADWVSIGLLDRGHDRGQGKGKGKVYLWSENQRRLFLSLLVKQGSVRRAVLLNIPVWLWLNWGDAYVPLRQVRRALAAWVGVNQRAGVKRARITARQVVGELDHPRAGRTARKSLRELVEKAAYGQAVGREELLKAARAVYDTRGARPSTPQRP